MAELENICEDEKRWCNFEGESKEETISVYCRCPKCGRFLKRGKLLMNCEGGVKLEGWNCKKHGDIQPYWERY